MRFFGLKSCDTCRKALKQLAEVGLDPKVTDVRADGLTDADRTQVIAEFGDAAVNLDPNDVDGWIEAQRFEDDLFRVGHVLYV